MEAALITPPSINLCAACARLSQLARLAAACRRLKVPRRHWLVGDEPGGHLEVIKVK
jgi:hypothetical protein